MTPTIDTIAEKAEVSAKTVSLVLNNRPFVSERTKQKVYKVINELKYQPHIVARELSVQKTKNIAFFFWFAPNRLSVDHFYHEVFEGIAAEAHRQEYHLMFISPEEEFVGVDLPLEMARSRKIEGMILAANLEDSMLEALNNEKFPTVLIQQDAIGDKVSSVIVDDNKGGYEAASYLISLGHNRIGLIGRNSEGSILKRIDGYKQALQDNGINYEEELIRESENGVETGYKAMKEYLVRMKELPTAIFATTDLTAIGAMRAIKEKGMKVPDDISIIGYDDVTISSYIDPPLTTMRIRKQELGREAVSELIRLLEDKEGKRIILQAELIVRGTCRKI